MKIAFLQAGFPPEGLEAEYGSYLTMFQDSFAACGADLELVDFHVQKGKLPDVDAGFDAYLCCGSPNSVYDDEPWIGKLLDFVRELDAKGRRMVGICFGHQLIAQALGGEVRKARQGWGVGNIKSEIVAQQPWMTPTVADLDLLYTHQDQVVRLPEAAELLLRAQHCPIAGFTIEDRFLAIQSHPEFKPEFLGALLNERRERIGSESVDAALPSLDREVDSKMVLGWISRFLAADGS